MVNAISTNTSQSTSRTRENESVHNGAREEKKKNDSSPRLSSGTDAAVSRPTTDTASTAYARHQAGDTLRRAQLEARLASSNGRTLSTPHGDGPTGTPTPVGTATPDRVDPAAVPGATPPDPTAAAVASATPEAGKYPEEIQEVVDLVQTGTVDDATRAELAEKFEAMDGPTSHAAMEAIRAEGLQDTFLDQVLRDENGNAVDPRIKTEVAEMMNTGRLDVYAETLATTSYNVHDPATSGRIGDPHFDPSTNGIYFTDAQLNAAGVEQTMAHETFHAFSNAHGGPGYSAMDEGLGISVIHYAYEDGTYSTAEAVYGTANWYRDAPRDPNYPMGSFQNADPKLSAFLDDIQARDRSGLDWRNDAQIASDYSKYWEQYNRFADNDGNKIPDWQGPGGFAEQAEGAMLLGRAFEKIKSAMGW